MAGKKTKSVSFDAMVKFFMNSYNIPTKKDFDKLLTRLDRIEKLVKTQTVVAQNTSRTSGYAPTALPPHTISSQAADLTNVRSYKQLSYPQSAGRPMRGRPPNLQFYASHIR